jgi:hypothetical protein
MIWSVSTFTLFNGATTPVSFTNVHNVTGFGGRGRHLRAHQVGPAALALPALEVAVRRRGAPLTGLKYVRVHAQAHRAARLPPVEACVLEDPVQALVLRLPLDAV